MCEVRTNILFVAVGVNDVDGPSSGVVDYGSSSGTLPYNPFVHHSYCFVLLCALAFVSVLPVLFY